MPVDFYKKSFTKHEGGSRFRDPIPISEDDFMRPMLSRSHCTTSPAMATDPWQEVRNAQHTRHTMQQPEVPVWNNTQLFLC